MTLLDNCIEYLTGLRNEGDGGVSDMDDGAIQREADRMANVLVNARSAFMDNDLDTEPEVVNMDPHSKLNPEYSPGPGSPRFVIYVKDHEPEEEPGWQFKLEVVDNMYLDSDSLPITAIAGGNSWHEAFDRAHDYVVTALDTNHCIF